RMRPVPQGVWGELYTGGDGLAIGYLNRPELTAERFVTVEIDGRPERVYRTGDRVRWMDDGALEFLGRTDFQVKIRGFRVEPGEVAALLAGRPGVADALVLARDDARGSKRLLAYVVAADGAEKPSPGELRQELKRRLPDYMVPSAIVVMDAFPQTPNGKVDRAALPEPEPPAAAGQAPPQGEVERAMAAVWQELLALPSVGVHDNFFEVGGHSLLLAQLQERLRAALGREVTMIELFQYPTIASLAAHWDAEAKADGPAKDAGRGRGAARRELLRRR
ncbi:MAG TPA: non-ribosomal peptide synthetase, partial [Longimicrobium sp.]|nr:non-ribosomal peptide synthetase [Longimicrobium sp.]